MNTPELRARCANELEAAAGRVPQLTAFVGVDGFVDEILHAVDQRSDPQHYTRIRTIAQFAERLAAAAGRSTNVELVNQLTKLGGNGPIMGNALASFGLRVTYVGALGHPTLHPVFQEFARRAEVHSIAEACHTDALEFDDGKLLLGKLVPLNDVTWANIEARFGRDQFAAKLDSASLVGFVNWTMVPYMSDLWEAILTELCPKLAGPRRKMFFDLADPEKRTAKDIRRAIELIVAFEKYFDVILGLNEKEACEVGRALGLATDDHSPAGLSRLAREIHARAPLSSLVVHPVAYALAVSCGQVSLVEGPFVARPKLTTGAGDHFNSGFCLGKLLGLDDAACVLTGVTTSGYYVRTGQSPAVADLVRMMRAWPDSDS
jgi:sugar/nucleoside kinase (ribokinase family)